jgi:hypothetical protein
MKYINNYKKFEKFTPSKVTCEEIKDLFSDMLDDGLDVDIFETEDIKTSGIIDSDFTVSIHMPYDFYDSSEPFGWGSFGDCYKQFKSYIRSCDFLLEDRNVEFWMLRNHDIPDSGIKYELSNIDTREVISNTTFSKEFPYRKEKLVIGKKTSNIVSISIFVSCNSHCAPEEMGDI